MRLLALTFALTISLGAIACDGSASSSTTSTTSTTSQDVSQETAQVKIKTKDLSSSQRHF
jgi:hypothetical protein